MQNIIKTAICLILIVFLSATDAQAQRGRRSRGAGEDRQSRGRDRRSRGERGGRGDRGNIGGRGLRGDSPTQRDGGSSVRGRSTGGSTDGDRGRNAGGGGFDMSRMTSRMSSMMDRDNDGMITEQELSRFPQSMRERMGLADVKSISVEDFRRKTTTRIQQRIDERTEQRERESKSRTSTGSPVFQQRKREKFTRPLPNEYVERDADGDGQIALFEWAAWERSEMSTFFEMPEMSQGVSFISEGYWIG